MLSAGMSFEDYYKMQYEDTDFDEKWDIFEKFWPYVRNTTYARAIKIILNDLFNISSINKENAIKVSETLNSTNKKGYYKKIIKQKCNIKVVILDFLNVITALNLGDYKLFSSVKNGLFFQVMKFDSIICINSAKNLSKIEKEDDFSIHSLKHYEEILERRFHYFLNNGAVGIKIGLAYHRTLNIGKATRADAEKAFNKILGIRDDELLRSILDPDAISFKDIKPFQDYIIYKLLYLAEDHKLPVQIHTGLLEGSGNYLGNSNPELLIPIFMEFKKINFDIFHLSWPYSDNLIAIAKMFKNVFVDFCWTHVISEKVAIDILEKSIQAIPIVKIFGFGGDYFMVEGTYAHLKIAKENIAHVLTKMILNKRITLNYAYEISEMILNKNIACIFNFQK
jgi:predicted TIM-barrel fold metal-dependent hydrolase